MSRRGVRHLVVFDDADAVGVLSMRDIVRVWTSDGRDLGDDARAEAGALAPARASAERVIVSTGSAAPRTCCLRGRRK